MTPSDDPYAGYRYRLVFSSRTVAGFSAISAFPKRSDTVGYRKSGAPPPAIGPEGQGTPFFISLENGITCDLGFGQWVSMVRCYGPATGKGSLLPEYKRPLTVEVYDEDGRVAFAYHLTRCWIAEYRAVPGPDACADGNAIVHLTAGFDGWEREPADE